MCQPKSLGGVGIRNLRLCNQVFLMKLAWGLINSPEALWVKVLKFKYSCGPLKVPEINWRPRGSNLWQGICSIWNLLREETRWIIENGQDVKLWCDGRIPSCHALLNYDDVVIPRMERNLIFSSYVGIDGDSDWPRLISHFPTCFISKIHAMLPPNTDGQPDSVLGFFEWWHFLC